MALEIFRRLFGRQPAQPPTLAQDGDDGELQLPEEHRTAGRDGTYKVATVTYPTGYERRGVVVDRSDTGVRVRFYTRGELPGHVTLTVESIAGRRRARVVWQETHEAGLAFERDK
ncbi:MAG: hypothetical protein GVY06_09535 [Alphaproteobacteria bacterium]|nr:hypothetical protein [Alphaproteobacteria bacterium]